MAKCGCCDDSPIERFLQNSEEYNLKYEREYTTIKKILNFSESRQFTHKIQSQACLSAWLFVKISLARSPSEEKRSFFELGSEKFT